MYLAIEPIHELLYHFDNIDYLFAYVVACWCLLVNGSAGVWVETFFCEIKKWNL